MMAWQSGPAPFGEYMLCAKRLPSGEWGYSYSKQEYVGCEIREDGTLDKFSDNDYDVPRVRWTDGEWEHDAPEYWCRIDPPGDLATWVAAGKTADFDEPVREYTVGDALGLKGQTIRDCGAK